MRLFLLTFLLCFTCIILCHDFGEGAMKAGIPRRAKTNSLTMISYAPR